MYAYGTMKLKTRRTICKIVKMIHELDDAKQRSLSYINITYGVSDSNGYKIDWKRSYHRNGNFQQNIEEKIKFIKCKSHG